jgi:radical SAM superfamily enzyme YgiQ (UPF0313 family)
MRLRDRRILLVAPEIVNMRSMPCVGLGYIGTYLKAKGLDVRIVDSQFTKEDPAPILASTPRTLVAIGVDSRTVLRGLQVARLAKRHGHVTLFGGLHVSLVKTGILDHAEVDYGIVGDGEVPTHQLVEALDGERSFDQVSGLVYRGRADARMYNPNVTEEADLDRLPFPDYRLAGIEQFPLYPLVTSRDCPYKCTYCTVGNISHGRFRGRSARSCVDEILLAKERYGIRGFLVVDENFSFRIDRALEFCQLLVEEKVNLPWTAFEGMRADCVTSDVLDLLKRSGCRWVFFGIESAENAVLRTVLKGQKFRTIERAASLVRSHGLKVGGFFIVGLPESTFERDMIAVDWATRSLDGSTFWMSIPYYNTALYHWVERNARLLRRPVGDNLVNSLSTMPFYDTPSYPAGEIKRAHTIANLRTGCDYFFEYMDREAYQTWRRGQQSLHARRRLVEAVVRYDPSWLPNIHSTQRALIQDPVALAVQTARMRAESREPLPFDVARAVQAGLVVREAR